MDHLITAADMEGQGGIHCADGVKVHGKGEDLGRNGMLIEEQVIIHAGKTGQPGAPGGFFAETRGICDEHAFLECR